MPALAKPDTPGTPSNDEALNPFLDHLIEEIEPYDHQEEAILALCDATSSSTPQPARANPSSPSPSHYQAPSALVRRLLLHRPHQSPRQRKISSPSAAPLGPENVGMITGDATVNARRRSSAAPPRSSPTSPSATAPTPGRRRRSWTSSTTTPTTPAAPLGRSPCSPFPKSQFSPHVRHSSATPRFFEKTLN